MKTVKAKSWIARMTASCLMMTMLLGGAASADSVQVTADRLNMRKEANASSKAVAVVEKDAALSFVSETDGWYQVKNGSKTGYVMSEYVKLDMAQVQADVDANTEMYSSAKTGRAAERVNMRSMPLTGADIVRVVGKNDKVSVLGKCGDWYQVSFGGKTGFMMGQYLNLEEDTPSVEDDGLIEINPEENYAAALTGKTTDRVNMRKEASVSAPVGKVLKKGTAVVLLGEAGDWYKVNLNGEIGYIAKAYVSVETADEDIPADEPLSETIYDEIRYGRTTERVNIRKDATTGSGVAKVLNKDENVALLGEKGDWYKVTSGGKEGYILKSYVVAGLTMYDSARTGKTRDEVNLRAAASTDSEILRVLPKNTQADVLGYTEEFYKVSVNGKEGYIASEYLSVSDKAGEKDEEIFEGDAVVPDDFVSYPAARTGATTERVNLRAAASTSADVNRIINKNTTVTVLGEQGNFYQVKVSDTMGYIAKAYVSLGETGEEAPSENGDTLYASPIAAKTTVSVNMRREPEGEILFTLPAGTSVQKLGEMGAWYKVLYGNSTGYIAKDYVSEEITVPTQPENSGSSDSATGKGTKAYITAQSVNMRRGAGTGYGVIKVLKHGDEITYYSLSDGWYLIKAGEDTGYVSQKYVSTAKPEAAPSNPGNESNGSVILSDWWTGDIRSTFKVGVIATVTDVETGLSWQVKRSGGTNHADVQPLTAEDTAKMKQAYGGKWSWNRRAIWVTVGGKRYAASMNGMPHGTGSIKTNNFDGHHCIHFLNSRTHTGNRLDSAHQAAVQKAYKAG